MRRFLTLVAVSLFALPALHAETATELAERFALADDREVVVANLVPGTDEHFYYRCLLWQHQGKLAEVDALLERWQGIVADTSRFERIRLRQAVLWVDRDAVTGAQRLAEEAGLDLQVSAAPAPVQAQSPRLPSVLDAKLYAPEALIAKAEANGRIDGWSIAGLQQRIAQVKDDGQRRAALKKLSHPIFPGAIEVVLADLAAPGGDFGSCDLHERLTIAQLDAVRAARPQVVEDIDYIETSILARRSRMDLDRLAMDDALRLAWLTELRQFAAPLPAVAEPLQAFLALHHLQEQLRAGRVTIADVAAVLARPLTPGLIVAPVDNDDGKDGKGGAKVVPPSNRLLKATGLEDITDATALLDEAIAAAFLAAPDISNLAGLGDEERLRQQFIEAKLLSGVGEAATWLTRPSDAEFGRALQNRIELRFARDVPLRFAGEAAVALPLILKQVPSLRVRIFALDAVNLYRQTMAEPSTDIDLAGVVPTHERLLTFAQPPIIRHREVLTLPECAGPGLWLIELVGGGQVARALLHKGALSFSTTTQTDGEHLSVLDETDRPVRDAVVWIGDQRFNAGADGSVRLPFVVERRSDTLVIGGGGRAARVKKDRRTESWSVNPGVMLDREQVIAGGQTTMVLRPHLTLCGTVIPFSHARDVQIDIATKTLTGMRRVTTVTPMGDPALAEWRVTFPCDEGVTSVQTTLRATVRNVARNQEEKLSAETTTHLNGDLDSGRLYDAYLESGPAGWSLALLGRAGEPLVDEPLELSLSHRWLEDPLVVSLATDATGRVHLGPLDDFTQVRWLPPRLARYGYDGVPMSPRLLERRWELYPQRLASTSAVLPVGQELRLPATWRRTVAGERDWWMLRGDGGAFAEDVSALTRLEDDHGVPILVAPALPAGRYQLCTPSGTAGVWVLAGALQGTQVVGPTMIERIQTLPHLGVGVLPQGDGVRIQVVGRTPSTRVHVMGLRFHPARVASFSGEAAQDYWHWPRPWLQSSYRQGHALDPEMGYILARTTAPRLPGVMLERPGLVLNPWIDDTLAAVGAGDRSASMFGDRSGGGKRRSLSKAGGTNMRESASDQATVIDFLAGPGVVLVNLVPDANGAVVLNAAQLGDSRGLLVQVCDATRTINTIATLPRTTLALRERRLMDGLPVDQHLVLQRRAQVLPAGGQATVRRSALDRSRLCATVADLLRLQQALNPDLGLQEFEPLARWATLDDAERRRWYAAHACHEVHLFLWHKDRRFFDAVVRPYLANKLQPGFIDQWLLEQDLTPWLAADRHSTLNLYERILLARRLGGELGAQEIASLRADVFADLPDEQAELGTRIAEILDAHGDATVAGRAPGEAEIELPPMKVTALKQDADQENQAEINVASEDYRDHTKPAVVIEQQWYRIPAGRDGADVLFAASAFWRAFAEWNGQGTFLPPTCLLPQHLNEVLVVLALCDLPFTSEPPRWSDAAEGRRVQVTTPGLLFSEEVVPQPLQAGAVVVHQRNYVAEALRIHGENTSPHTGAFAQGTMYVARSVVLNPTPQTITIALLAQTPTGSVALGRAPATATGEVLIPPYKHVEIDQVFYFPQAGTFTHYPTHVHAGAGVYAAVSEPRCIVGGDSAPAAGGAQSAQPAMILEQLSTQPRGEVDLDSLRWRFSDAGFWRACVAILERRRWYEDAVWSASLLHRDTARMAVWLRSQPELVERLGRTIHSRWLTIDALGDGGVIHADITPLTNARAHRIPGASAKGNDQVIARRDELLQRLCLLPRLEPRDRLELAYTLTLQDRLTDASAQFARIDRAAIAARLQYDYLGAYLALGRGDLASAARFAAIGKDHPVAHWRLRFGEVLAQLDEIAGRPATREAALGDARRQDTQAANMPTFQARLNEGTSLVITASNLTRCTIRMHRLDLEPLFSQAPFATASAARSTWVRAAFEREVAIDAKGQASVAIPAALQHQAVAIEVAAAGQSQVLTTFADALDVRLAPGSGQLQVLHAKTAKPLSATYVKVYIERPDGRVVFHKDGYTDLRGRFDYASLGTGSVGAAKRIALFISHDEAGATVREVLPP